jgi:hypothetical protein
VFPQRLWAFWRINLLPLQVTEIRVLRRLARSLVLKPTGLSRVRLLFRNMTGSGGNMKIPVPAGNGTPHRHVTISETGRESSARAHLPC